MAPKAPNSKVANAPNDAKWFRRFYRQASKETTHTGQVKLVDFGSAMPNGLPVNGFRGSPGFAARRMHFAGCIATPNLDIESLLFVSWFFFLVLFPGFFPFLVFECFPVGCSSLKCRM